MLAIARALAGKPELLMLDEGVTILLVEQNARMTLAVSDRVLVLGKGAVVFAGPTVEFRRREQELKGRYLSV